MSDTIDVMRAIILTIGDELVLGQTVDTNSAYLSDELTRRGIPVLYHQTIADDREAISAAVCLAASMARLVLVAGGLGPTQDDLTRQALSDALESELEEDSVSIRAIEERFARRGKPMPTSNRIQAMRPRGTQTIPNDVGTAPGIKARLGKATIYVAPGVPSELRHMFEQAIVPEIERIAGVGVILTDKVNTFGWGESEVAEVLGDLMDRRRNPKVGTTVSGGIVSIRVRSEFPDDQRARHELEQTVQQIEQALGPIAFGRGETTLTEATVHLLIEQQRTLTTAESCTGGMLGAIITEVAGVSQVYLGGWVTYANETKMRELGVNPRTLDVHGAVSAETAREMAAGALRGNNAELALAITGIAGPDGGTADKPVGTIWISVGQRDSSSMIKVQLMRLALSGDRESIRRRSCLCALQMLRLTLLNQPLDLIRWGHTVA